MTVPSADVFDEDDVLRSCCRSSFRRFIREAWHLVPGAGTPVWNWHMWAIADEMQRRAEDVFAGRPRRHDVVINISPGTSKSTICSILFHPWTWTQMPTARHLNASHTSDLVLDLAYKSREVIRSEWYRRLFPEVVLCDDADAKGLFRNTAGGDRLACTVAGRSPMGFHAHFITCLPYDSRIITDVGELPIGRVVEEGLEVRVLGWDHAADRPAWNTIESWQKNQPKPLSRVSFSDGTSINLTEEHPVFVKDRGYVPAVDLRIGDEVIHASRKEMPGMRDHSDSHSAAERRRLLWGTLQWEARGQGAVQTATGSEHASLFGLREVGVSKPGSFCSDEIVHRRLLFDGVSSRVDEWRRASKVFQSNQVLRGLREAHTCFSMQGAIPSLLQQRVLREGGKWKEPSKVSETGQDEVWLVRPVDPRASEGIGSRSLLWEGMRGRGSFSSDAGRRQFQLSARVRGKAVSQEVLSDASHDSTEGRGSVFFVREGPTGERGGLSIGRASSRFRCDEQPEGQFGRSLPVVSCQDAWSGPGSLEVRSKVVVSVERAVWIPRAVYNLGLHQNHNFFAEGTLVHNCDDPIDPKKVLSAAELKTAREFMTSVLPTRKVDKKVSVTFLIMQRLHAEDPTAVMLETARKSGATPVKHYCLPGELMKLDDGSWDASAVRPRKLAANYVDGVMDPGRLDRAVLNTFRAQLGAYGFAGQFLQSPTPPGGGMFKATYFNQRVKAAPYHAKRIRYWDRAASQDSGCRTAGVLLALANDGNFYVEHVVAGQWEPTERNEQMRATAIRDKLRYGPKHAPVIWVEAEGGSSGRDAWKGVALALAGFPVREDRVTGNKVTRAEPWSAQLAARNVFIVDNDGSPDWDVQGYVDEHVTFPLGKLKDVVDASSGAFNLMVGRKAAPQLRVLSVGGKKGMMRIVSCSKDELGSIIVEEASLMIVVEDPLPPGEAGTPDGSLPSHSCLNLVEGVRLTFADVAPAEVQSAWNEPLESCGRKPEEVIMRPEDGKRMWAAIAKRRSGPSPILLFVDDGGPDRRALSLAMAVCDVVGQPRSSIHRPSRPDEVVSGDPPNAHVHAIAKASRVSVV